MGVSFDNERNKGRKSLAWGEWEKGARELMVHQRTWDSEASLFPGAGASRVGGRRLRMDQSLCTWRQKRSLTQVYEQAFCSRWPAGMSGSANQS